MNIEALRFFLKLYELRNLSEAADATGISPSAASRMLGKLRELFGDELFHRYAHGMTPTVRSHALYEPTLQLLSAYGKLFDTTAFDPTSLNRIFKIGAVDKAVSTFFAPAFAELFQDCPNLSIEFRHPGQSYNRDLIRGDLDMGIFPNLTPEPGFHAQILCEETMVLVVGPHHPLVELQASRPLEKADFEPYRLIKVTHAMPAGYDDKWSTTVASVPHVGNGDAAVWTPYFLSVPAMLDSSDFFSIIPMHLARQLAMRHRLHVLGRPEHAPIFSPTLLWHDRTHYDPASQWFRAKIISRCRGFQSPSTLPVIPY